MPWAAFGLFRYAAAAVYVLYSPVFVSSCDFLTIVCDIHGICSTFFVCLFYFSFFKHFYKFTFFTFLWLYIYVNLQIVANYSAILYGNVESMLFMFLFNPWGYLIHSGVILRNSINYLFLFHFMYWEIIIRISF